MMVASTPEFLRAESLDLMGLWKVEARRVVE